MTSSTKPMESIQHDAAKRTTKYWDKMGRLNLLMGSITAKDHHEKLKEQNKNIEAENAAVRDWIWKEGAKNVTGKEDDDEMFNLGDINESHTHYHQPSPPTAAQTGASLAKTIGAVGLAAAGLGAGAALPVVAYNLTKGDTVQAADDSDTQYGLRIFRESDE